jgi:uncharacterized protein YraI
MNIKRNALRAGLVAALFLTGTAASFAAAAYATSSVNVRQGPGTNYRVVDQLRPGESVDVRGCQGGWCRVEHSGPDGWVSANYLSRDYNYDDDFYIDDEPDFFLDAPRRPHRPYFFPPRRPSNSVCIGGSNASFCITD